MRVLAVASGKGGVGKTTIAAHLAGGFAQRDARVLLVDLDQGAHATRWLIGARAEVGIAEAMLREALEPELVVAVEDRPGLYIAPSSPGLDTVDAALSKEFARETILARVLKAKRKPQFDVVVIDCPPGTGFLIQSALYAADSVLVPVPCGDLGIDGLLDIRRLVEQVRSRSRARVDIGGCIVFAADEREAVTTQTRADLAALGKEHVFSAEIRISTAAKKLPRARALAIDPGVDPRGEEDYRALVRQTWDRIHQ